MKGIIGKTTRYSLSQVSLWNQTRITDKGFRVYFFFDSLIYLIVLLFVKLIFKKVFKVQIVNEERLFLFLSLLNVELKFWKHKNYSFLRFMNLRF